MNQSYINPLCLSKVQNYITAIYKRQHCAAVFIDPAKAFDSVSHCILIGRLNSLGFSNDCLAWFTNYFSDRVQCVKSEGLLSGPLAVSMGVPTGFNSSIPRSVSHFRKTEKQ
jgi:hypothetical protein